MTTDTLPKSEWGPGPWQDEPDEARWVDKATGLRCAIIRNVGTGAFGGYVEIDHPSLCLPMLDLPAFDVHGGVTYSGLRFQKRGETGWWIGFDCWHLNDITPAMDARLRILGQEPSAFDRFVEALDWSGGAFRRAYWQIDMVRAECASLARQVREAGQRAE